MEWKDCKHILIMRPDNMGDLLMSSPAIRAIKETFGCKITLLTSALAAETASMIVEIDETLVFNLPWLKFEDAQSSEKLFDVVALLKSKRFDGCILFNVFSQNPAPCLMLAYLAGIPMRASYSRENVYGLLSHWLPDKEPYFTIRHQTERDLLLAEFIGASTTNKRICIHTRPEAETRWQQTMADLNVDPGAYLIIHAGVSEIKRRYPTRDWIEVVSKLATQYRMPLLFTGTNADAGLIKSILSQSDFPGHNLAGELNVNELACCIRSASALVTVNSGPAHLAAAVGTPLVVLYAKTNPQHTPWMVPNRVLKFEFDQNLSSKNQILEYLNTKLDIESTPFPDATVVIAALKDLLNEITRP